MLLVSLSPLTSAPTFSLIYNICCISQYSLQKQNSRLFIHSYFGGWAHVGRGWEVSVCIRRGYVWIQPESKNLRTKGWGWRLCSFQPQSWQDWDPRAVFHSEPKVWKQSIFQLHQTGRVPSYLMGVNLFVLFRFSTNWIRVTDTRVGNGLYLRLSTHMLMSSRNFLTCSE